ncbi:hypothetical protein [Sinomonas gamaensis]|uniref:hypothetical protein n=1 Tax=Sinomonas gamaensis TaxID=2565624 RepID=UPI002015F668|nr:hypothetical protein [Sinomonas gamaensis]
MTGEDEHRPWSPFAVGGEAYRRSSEPRRAVVEQFEIFVGFLAFWALFLFIVTVWLEVTGQPALGWALGLAAVLAAMAILWAVRRRVLRGHKNEPEP